MIPRLCMKIRVEPRSASLVQGPCSLSEPPNRALSGAGAGKASFNCWYLPTHPKPRRPKIPPETRLATRYPAPRNRAGRVASAGRCRRRSPSAVDPPTVAVAAEAAEAAGSVQGGRCGAATAGGRPVRPPAQRGGGGGAAKAGGGGGGGVGSGGPGAREEGVGAGGGQRSRACRAAPAGGDGLSS